MPRLYSFASAEVARECHIPSALLWTQPAAVLDIYYYYFHGYADEINNHCTDSNWKIELPGLQIVLEKRDLPSFLLPSSSEIYSFALSYI